MTRIIKTYIVADESTVFAETSTRDQAREYLRDIKACGNKSAKIFQETYIRTNFKQVR